MTSYARIRTNDRGASAVQIALIAVSVALVLLIAYAVFVVATGSEPEAGGSSSPSATASASASPSASATPTAPASWADVDPADLPAPVADPHPGEPPSHTWDPWIWPYVDASWDVDIWCQPNPAAAAEDFPVSDACLFQALYLVAPDGARFRLYSLRTDVGLGIEAKALDEHVVWIVRYFYEAAQTVQFDLLTGTASETWADAGFSNVSPTQNANGWFVFYEGTLADGRMLWEGSGYGEPLNGVFFRAPGGAITPSAISPSLGGGYDFAPDCVGVDTDVNLAIYTGYSYVSGQPVANWPARLLVHDLTTDTWNELTRLGPYGTPCHDDFNATATYYIGLANRVDQSGLFRYFFDGSPDQPA